MRDLRELDAAGKKTTGSMAALAKAAAGAFAAFLTVDAAVRGIKALGSAAIEAERSNLRLVGVLRATGHAAGLTAGDVKAFADEMQRTTLFDDEQVKDAAAAMLTFRSVQGETFKEGLRLAADMASIFGGGEGSLRQSVVQLGKALEDPQRGVSALREIGVTFSIQQTEIIKKLQAENKLFEAQKLVLEGVAAQLKGTAEAMARPDSLLGATNALGDAWRDMLERIATTPRTLEPVIAAFNKLAEIMGKIAPGPEARIAEIKAQLAAMPAATETSGRMGFLGALGRAGGSLGDLFGLGPSPAEAFRRGQGAFAARNREELLAELARLQAQRGNAAIASLLAQRDLADAGGGGGGGGGFGGPRVAGLALQQTGRAAGLPRMLGIKPEAATIGVKSVIRQMSDAAIMATIEEKNRIADAIAENFGDGLRSAVVDAFSTAFETGSITAGIKALGKGLLASMGELFIEIGKHLIKFGTIIETVSNWIRTSLFTSGPAAILAGIALIALGTGLTAASSGGFGGGGGGGASRGSAAAVTRSTLPAVAQGSAATLQPATTIFAPTIIGIGDLPAQRAITRMVDKGRGRNIGQPSWRRTTRGGGSA